MDAVVLRCILLFKNRLGIPLKLCSQVIPCPTSLLKRGGILKVIFVNSILALFLSYLQHIRENYATFILHRKFQDF
jgi:hypothetical protein